MSLHIAAEIVRSGRIGLKQDRAAGGVAPHQRALRPLEDIHAVHVEQRAGQADGAGVINAVHIDRRRGVEGQARIAALAGTVEIALAADGDVQRVLPEGAGLDIHRRRDGGQILDRLDVKLVEIAWLSAVMEIGTVCASSARLRAVTMTVSSPVTDASVVVCA